MARRLAVAAAVAVALLTVASLFGRWPYLELATHFRLQYAVAASVALVPLAAFRSWRAAALAAACAATNWGCVVPYYLAPPPGQAASDPAARAGTPVRLMLANVHYRNRDYGALVEAVRRERPDVLVLQELTERWWAGVSELKANYPHYYALPRVGGSGIGLLSRLPLERAEVVTFDMAVQPGLLARLDAGGAPLTLLAIHPPTPMRAGKLELRNAQLERSAAIMREAAGAKILLGDLNTSIWSPYYLDLLLASGLGDARAGSGLWPTWPAPFAPLVGIPIDHCLVGGGVRVRGVRAGEYTGSDHLPLIVDVAIPSPAEIR